MTWTEILALIEPVLLIFLAVGGYIGLRSGLAKAETEVQERVRAALHDENELLRTQVKRLESENRRLTSVMTLVMAALKKTHGIDLEINEDMIILRDGSGSHISHIQRPQAS